MKNESDDFTLISKACKGFTLIELLVTISIIGLLASLALISYSASQKQARDSQRKSDLKQYQNALELFANQNDGLFPSRPVSAGVQASVTLCGDLGLVTCPEDPRNSEDSSFEYKYQSLGSVSDGAPTATDYVLWGKVEGGTSTTYWVLCGSGQVGEATSGLPPSSPGVCPL